METWESILGFSKHEASSIGSIRNLKTKKILSQQTTKKGYKCVKIISDSGKNKTVFVHTLVCIAFHGKKPTDLAQVNHLDGIKSNNNFENLQWCSASQNFIHNLYELGNIKKLPRGHAWHWRAIFTDDEIRKIRSLRKSGLTYVEIAEVFKKSSWRTICNILTNRCYTHVKD